jgi:hypothetical protein
MNKGKPFPDENSKQNQVVSQLREKGPLTSYDLPRPPNLQDKRWIGILDVTKSTGSAKSRGRTKAVYYLYGDERRAVRTYIEENTDFVASCMEDKVNPINMGMEDYWWRMFCEEWVWSGHDDQIANEA